MGRVFVVGVSQAFPKLPPASTLVGSKVHLDLYPHFEGERLLLKPPFESLFLSVEERLEEGDVVVLATGDPLFYGIAQRVVDHFGKDRVEVIPNLSYMQLAFARMGAAWQEAGFFSLHGRGFKGLLRALTLTKRHLFLFTDSENSPGRLARYLVDCQVRGVKLWVFSRLGMDDEEVVSLSPSEAADCAFAEPNCVVAEKEREVAPRVFLPDSEFRTAPGLLTKSQVRSMVLSLLEPDESKTFWDIGAGSGAVSISLSPLVETVYAVEKDPEHLSILRDNQARHGAWNLIPVAGRAPRALYQLPDPHGIFVGTGGELLEEILETCWHRLLPGGVMVATVVTLSGMRRLLEWGRGEVLSIALSRGMLEKRPDFLEPSKPVWVLMAKKG